MIACTPKNVALILIALIAIVIMPLLFVWSIRTLFLLDTPYCFKSWVATWVFMSGTGGLAAGASSRRGKNAMTR